MQRRIATSYSKIYYRAGKAYKGVLRFWDSAGKEWHRELKQDQRTATKAKQYADDVLNRYGAKMELTLTQDTKPLKTELFYAAT